MRESPVAIVCGYDRFSDLHLYAEQVASEIAAARVDRIIVTGGFTSRDSYHSEAWLMARVLAVKLPHAVVVLEEWAMTTVDNLIYSRAIALRRFAGAASFVVFCDHAHRMKAAILTRIILGANATVRSIPRAVSWLTLALEPVSIVCESVCAVAPPLRRLLSRAAAAWKGVGSSVYPSRSEGSAVTPRDTIRLAQLVRSPKV
jgi:hypothetical protein